MHKTNEINTTNGGSSGNCSGNLPHNQLEIFASLSALDYNWLSLPPDNLLKAMQDSLNGLKALSMNLSADTLRLVFDENSISAYENDSQLFSDVMLWLECALNNRVGRAQIRMNILNHFNHCFSSPIAEPMLADVNEQAPAPVPSDGLAPSCVNRPVKEENVVRSDSDFDNKLKEASKRASQLLKGANSILFDGVTNPNLYCVYRFDLRELMLSSGSRFHSLVSFEVVMLTLRGPALQIARQHICAMDLYHCDDAVARLWNFLDATYMTTDAVRYVSELYNSCKQFPQETLAAYISRFQRISHIVRSQQPIDDVSLIIKLSSGLVTNTALMARGIVDAMSISSFNSYCIQLVNVSRSMENVVNGISKSNPNHHDVKNNAGDVKQNDGRALCLRCGGSHVIEKCDRVVKYPCQYCGSNEHFSRICPKGTRHGVSKHRPRRSFKPYRDGGKRPVPAAAMGATVLDRLENVDTDSDQSTVTNSVFAVSSNSAGLNFDPRLVDLDDPMIDVLINAKLAPIQQACLMDTGAGANFISVQLAETLIKYKAVMKKEIIQLPSPITITYGNSTTERVDCALPIRIKTSGDDPHWVELLFVVTPNSSYSMILGRTGLKQLGLINLEPKHMFPSIPPVGFSACSVNALSADVMIQTSNPVCEVQSSIAVFSISTSDSSAVSSRIDRPSFASVTPDNRIQVNHSLLESAVVLPYRAPRRSRSNIDVEIIKKKLDQMVKQGKVEISDSKSCHMVHELVLVDKWAEKRIPRTVPNSIMNLNAIELHSTFAVEMTFNL